MIRILLDENLDRRLKSSFASEYEVLTVSDQGWSGIKNGKLLRAAEATFDVLVTLDRNLSHQQHLPKYDLAVLLLKATSSRRAEIEPLMPEVNQVVRRVEPGKLYTVPS